MKTNLFLLTATIFTLLFTSCKKTEEINPIQKNLVTLQQTSWDVISVSSPQKEVELTWQTKFPKLNFRSDYIEMKLGRDNCTKYFSNGIGQIQVNNLNSCQITNPEHQMLSTLLEGEFTVTTTTSGDVILKNNIDTEILLRVVNQINTTQTQNFNINL
jgi:hypothetical protein